MLISMRILSDLLFCFTGDAQPGGDHGTGSQPQFYEPSQKLGESNILGHCILTSRALHTAVIHSMIPAIQFVENFKIVLRVF